MTLKNIKQQGFTIVELLIVIVVIGILAAITIIAYTGITSQANQKTALSNADATRNAALTYYAENGAYPAVTGTTLTASTYTSLPSSILVYTTGTAITQGNSNILYKATAAGTGACYGYWPAGSGNVFTVITSGTVGTTASFTNTTTPTCGP